MPVIKTHMLEKDFKASFLSCEKDTETILKKLFIESKPYSDILKSLLIIDKKDCLSDRQKYQSLIDNMSIKDLKDKEYVRLVPRIDMEMHEDVRSYMILEFDDFVPTENLHYRDCTISFTILCHLDHWELDDYKLRPHQIAGYIDGILNNARLSGIGTLNFMGASQVILDENLGGIILRYIATHGNDDKENISQLM